MIDDIIMNLFMDTTKQPINSVHLFYPYKIKYDKMYLYQGYLQDYPGKKTIGDTKKITYT